MGTRTAISTLGRTDRQTRFGAPVGSGNQALGGTWRTVAAEQAAAVVLDYRPQTHRIERSWLPSMRCSDCRGWRVLGSVVIDKVCFNPCSAQIPMEDMDWWCQETSMGRMEVEAYGWRIPRARTRCCATTSGRLVGRNAKRRPTSVARDSTSGGPRRGAAMRHLPGHVAVALLEAGAGGRDVGRGEQLRPREVQLLRQRGRGEAQEVREHGADPVGELVNAVVVHPRHRRRSRQECMYVISENHVRDVAQVRQAPRPLGGLSPCAAPPSP